jgi:hypothetical protein
MIHGLQREHETCSGAVLEARERTPVAGALAAEHEAAMPAVVPPHEQPELSPARPYKSDAQDSKYAAATRGRRPAVHALALAVVVHPRGPLRTREMRRSAPPTRARTDGEGSCSPKDLLPPKRPAQNMSSSESKKTKQ